MIHKVHCRVIIIYRTHTNYITAHCVFPHIQISPTNVKTMVEDLRHETYYYQPRMLPINITSCPSFKLKTQFFSK